MRAFLAMPNVELKAKARWGLKFIGLSEMLDVYDDVKRTAPPTRSNQSKDQNNGPGVREKMALSKFSTAEIDYF